MMRHFLKLTKKIKRITELTHFKRNKKVRIVCDATKKGLRAVLQQQWDNQDCNQCHLRLDFLFNCEAKYSINKLELLAVVWAIEHFDIYVYGVKFQVISDHKALPSVLKPNRSNKAFTSRLTRWVDWLLPFKFEVIHAPGLVLGFAGYLSKHPSEIKGSVVNSEKLMNDWFIVNTFTKIDAIPEKERTPLGSPNAMSLPRAPNSVLRVESEHKKKKKNKKIISQSNRMKVTCGQTNGKSVRYKIQTKSASKKSKIVQNTSSEDVDKINESFLTANFEAGKMRQKVFQLLKSKEGANISRLPAPWRKNFISFSVDRRNCLYMDERLVIPANLRASISSSKHYGDLGRDTMFRYISNIWWPKIHREVVTAAKCCDQCNAAGKNVEPSLIQTQLGKIPKSDKPNEGIALGLAGSFQNAENGKIIDSSCRQFFLLGLTPYFYINQQLKSERSFKKLHITVWQTETN